MRRRAPHTIVFGWAWKSAGDGSAGQTGNKNNGEISLDIREAEWYYKCRQCARVVELADSLDSGSSVHSGRAGSSPASRTKNRGTTKVVPLFLVARLRRGAKILGGHTSLTKQIGSVIARKITDAVCMTASVMHKLKSKCADIPHSAEIM